ncbi:MAG TPA: hypothetical protein VFK06_25035 [Candidatus Angelobacter sp.]|nr:hypothetical protein [Candidatus Angelobacter sp.]
MLRAIISTLENKPFLGALSIAISVLAYSIYIRDTVKKEGIRPHPFSWLLWGFVTTVAAFAQHAKGAGSGLWVTAFTAAICFLIGMLTLSRNDWQFSSSDWYALILGVAATVLYALARNPTAAAILATVADVVGYNPTIKKGWIDPSTENATSFLLNSLKFIPALGALHAYSIATWLYPATLVVVNGAVCVMLVCRRRQLGKAHL